MGFYRRLSFSERGELSRCFAEQGVPSQRIE